MRIARVLLKTTNEWARVLIKRMIKMINLASHNRKANRSIQIDGCLCWIFESQKQYLSVARIHRAIDVNVFRFWLVLALCNIHNLLLKHTNGRSRLRSHAACYRTLFFSYKNYFPIAVNMFQCSLLFVRRVKLQNYDFIDSSYEIPSRTQKRCTLFRQHWVAFLRPKSQHYWNERNSPLIHRHISIWDIRVYCTAESSHLVSLWHNSVHQSVDPASVMCSMQFEFDCHHRTNVNTLENESEKNGVNYPGCWLPCRKCNETITDPHSS